MHSRLVFRSAHGPWSVWTCACGCDEAVRVTNQNEIDCGYDERYYVASHAPLGASADRKGGRYTPEAENLASEAPIDNGDVSVEYAPNEPDISRQSWKFEDEPTLEWVLHEGQWVLRNLEGDDWDAEDDDGK